MFTFVFWLLICGSSMAQGCKDQYSDEDPHLFVESQWPNIKYDEYDFQHPNTELYIRTTGDICETFSNGLHNENIDCFACIQEGFERAPNGGTRNTMMMAIEETDSDSVGILLQKAENGIQRAANDDENWQVIKVTRSNGIRRPTSSAVKNIVQVPMVMCFFIILYNLN